MEKTQSLEEFYSTKLNWMPDNLKKEIGHFNVFKMDDYVGCTAKPIPYSRKDYFKISLIVGKNRVHYADKTIEIQEQALLFAGLCGSAGGACKPPQPRAERHDR